MSSLSVFADGTSDTSSTNPKTDTKAKAPAGGGTNPIVGTFIGQHGKEIQAGYDKCIKSGKQPSQCETMANEECYWGSGNASGHNGLGSQVGSAEDDAKFTDSQATGACANFANTLSVNDKNMNKDEIGRVFDRIISTKGNGVELRLGNLLNNINCLDYYGAKVKNSNNQRDKYLNDKFKSLYLGQASENFISTIPACADILGTNFMDKKSASINNELICGHYLGDVNIRQAHYDAGMKEYIGDDACSGGGDQGMSSSGLQEKVANYGRTTDEQTILGTITAKCDDDLSVSSYAGKKACKDDLIGEAIKKAEGAQEASYGSTNGCSSARNNVKMALLDNNGDTFKAYTTKLLAGCVSLAELSEKVELEDPDVAKGEKSYESIDSQIRCLSRVNDESPYAIDYKACKQAAYWYNTFVLTNDLAAPVLGSAYEQINEIDIQGDAASEAARGGVDGQTAGLRAQQKVYKNKARVENTKMALEASRGLAMFGNMMSYPTPSLVSTDWCLDARTNEYKLEQGFSCSILHMAEKNENIYNALFYNQDVKGIMLQTGALAFSKAVVHAIVAKTYNKQAGLVGQVEKALTDADFNQPGAGFDMGPAFCDQNPTSPSCGGRGGRVSTGGVDFSFGGAGAGGNGNVAFEDGAANANSPTSNNAVRPTGKAKDDLSNILGGSSNNKGSGKNFKKVAAAKTSAGGGGGGGGSGGGGGGASAGGGGGGGGSDAKARGRGPASTGKSLKAKYTTGTGGRSITGGSVGRKKRSSNPFASLTRRGPAGGKTFQKFDKHIQPRKVKLFDAISKRYAEVAKNNRLEVVK